MCPMCWAVAVASFCGLFAASLLVVAGKDLVTVALVVSVALPAALHRWSNVVFLPWWCYVALLGLAIIRVGYLVVVRWRKLLIVEVWVKARGIATRRCPNKTVPVLDPES